MYVLPLLPSRSHLVAKTYTRTLNHMLYTLHATMFWLTTFLEKKLQIQHFHHLVHYILQISPDIGKHVTTYIDGCFSFCFVTFLKLNQIQNSQRTEKYFSRRQAFTSFPTWLPQVFRNVDLLDLSDSVWKNVHNMNTVVLCSCEIILYSGVYI